VLKEHIHPRATLMAALGKVMRGDTGIVLCTELAAYFAIKEVGQKGGDHVTVSLNISFIEMRSL
jgi:acyl-coenzyme A thioesterase PaaI-like protein